MDNQQNLHEDIVYSGFKLISFELKDNELFGNIKYEFIDKDDEQDNIYTTVLIGPNGTLKSRLFQKIISLFWNLYELKIGNEAKFQDKFSLEYSINNLKYYFSNFSENIEGNSSNKNLPYIYINNKLQKSFKDIELPISIIAEAIMLTDRYPFPDPEKFTIYKYLGSRYRPQLASTKTFTNRVVELVSQNINAKSLINGIKKIANEFLKNHEALYITYYTINSTRFFSGNLNITDFYAYFNAIDGKYKKTNSDPPFKLNHFKSKIENNPTLAQQIVAYCKNIHNTSNWKDYKANSKKPISFNLIDESEIDTIGQKFSLLDHMRQLGMVYPPEIEIQSTFQNSKLKPYSHSLDERSSGEINIIASMIGLIASIQPNSLIFIDEPEISLHPNWQMKYLTFLRELLSDERYSTCHLLVATHSHFLISDLEKESSSVIALSRDEQTNQLLANLLEGSNTFGWSAEQILLEVFRVPTTRNYFIADKVGEILEMVSKVDRNDVAIKEKVKELLELNIISLSEEDPLKPVIDRLIEKYA